MLASWAVVANADAAADKIIHGDKKIMEENKEQQILNNLARIKHRVMVMSGKGGVGKSFIAVSLAYGLAMQGKTVGILDSDIHGPSIAKLTGIEGAPLYEHKESGRPMPVMALNNLHVLSVASLISSDDSALIWRGPMKMALIKQFFSDFEWPALDYLIVDCPPGTGDEPLSVVQTLGKVDGAVIVTTPQDVALIDVRKSVSFVEQLKVPILGIIENMKYFVCPHCGERSVIFDGNKVQELVFEKGLDVLAELELDPNIGSSGDRGRPYIYDYGKHPNAEKLQEAVNRVITKLEGNPE